MEMLFRASGATCFLVAGVSLYKLDFGLSNAVPLAIFVGAPSIVALVFLNIARFSYGFRLALFFGLFTISVPVYAFEMWLHYQYGSSEEKIYSRMEKQTGQPYDRRTRAEVIRDMWQQGKSAYPNNPDLFLSPPTEDFTGIWPLANRSGVSVVVCNETGRYYIPTTDRYGLTNPDSIHDLPSRDIALVGDSFAQGGCVEDNTATQLRKTFPGTTSLGLVGAGPGLQYALLKEYLDVIGPKYVFWLYFENDLSDLVDELKQPVFRKYIEDPNYSQNLVGRQQEVDQVLDTFMEGFERKASATSLTWRPWRPTDIFLLRRTRQQFAMNLTGPRLQGNDIDTISTALPTFESLLVRTKEIVRNRGGELVFIYLPSSVHFISGGRSERLDYKLRDDVIKIVDRQQIPMIDMKAAFDKNDAPLGEYFWYAGSHYNIKGYKLVSRHILDFIGSRQSADEGKQ